MIDDLRDEADRAFKSWCRISKLKKVDLEEEKKDFVSYWVGERLLKVRVIMDLDYANPESGLSS